MAIEGSHDRFQWREMPPEKRFESTQKFSYINFGHPAKIEDGHITYEHVYTNPANANYKQVKPPILGEHKSHIPGYGGFVPGVQAKNMYGSSQFETTKLALANHVEHMKEYSEKKPKTAPKTESRSSAVPGTCSSAGAHTPSSANKFAHLTDQKGTVAAAGGPQGGLVGKSHSLELLHKCHQSIQSFGTDSPFAMASRYHMLKHCLQCNILCKACVVEPEELEAPCMHVLTTAPSPLPHRHAWWSPRSWRRNVGRRGPRRRPRRRRTALRFREALGGQLVKWLPNQPKRRRGGDRDEHLWGRGGAPW
jgi:hypothetical protein